MINTSFYNLPSMQCAAVIRCLFEIRLAPQYGCSSYRDENRPTTHGYWSIMTASPPIILLYLGSILYIRLESELY